MIAQRAKPSYCSNKSLREYCLQSTLQSIRKRYLERNGEEEWKQLVVLSEENLNPNPNPNPNPLYGYGFFALFAFSRLAYHFYKRIRFQAG